MSAQASGHPLEQKGQQLVSQGKFYEALQMYKMVVHRMLVRKDSEAAAGIARRGAHLLLEHGQSNAGAELGCKMISLYKQLGWMADNEEALGHVIALVKAFPGDMDTAKVSVVSAALRWSEHADKSPSMDKDTPVGHPHLHALAGAGWLAQGEFGRAQSHLVRAGDGIAVANMLRTWLEQPRIHASQRDLFVARALLLLLCTGALAAAEQALEAVHAWWPAEQRTPLLRFCAFLLPTLRRGARGVALALTLRKRYAWSLSRDPVFGPYLDQVLSLYCDYKAPSANPLSDLMESMFGGAS